jgi:microcystin-dependent protein
MSNYNLQVSWSGKDALSDSDADKVISGGDFNTEFLAVKTAVNSKADLNGSATETFSAVTAAAGTSTTQVATTAFVETATSSTNIADQVYPIGSIFTTVTAYANSAAVVTAIGGTTWVAFAAGKMLIGLDSSDTDFDTAEETGGAKTHTLTASEIPDHNHVYKYLAGQGSGSGVNFAGSSTALAHTWTATTDETVSTSTNHSLDTAGIAAGTYPGGSAHSIMNPYIAVYMWKRTA